MNYRITWSSQARKHFRQLDKPVQERVNDNAVEPLAKNPRPLGPEPVVGVPGVWRVREGDYRVLYRIEEERNEVWIEDVRRRREVYRRR